MGHNGLRQWQVIRMLLLTLHIVWRETTINFTI